MQYVKRELQPKKKKKQVKCTKGPSRRHRKCKALREETAVCRPTSPRNGKNLQSTSYTKQILKVYDKQKG